MRPVFRGKQQHTNGKQPLRLEAGIHAIEFNKAARHQPRPADQHQRKSHFGHHQCATEKTSPAGDGSPGVAESVSGAPEIGGALP